MSDAHPKPWDRDIRLQNLLEDIARNGPEAIEKYPAALRVALEFGDTLRRLAYLVRTGDASLVRSMYTMIETQLIRSIETHTHAYIVCAADDARRDERRYWERRGVEEDGP
jgi:hypothetical protein